MPSSEAVLLLIDAQIANGQAFLALYGLPGRRVQEAIKCLKVERKKQREAAGVLDKAPIRAALQ